MTQAQYLIPPLGKKSCSDNDVNLKTKGRKNKGKEKLNEHVGIW